MNDVRLNWYAAAELHTATLLAFQKAHDRNPVSGPRTWSAWVVDALRQFLALTPHERKMTPRVGRRSSGRTRMVAVPAEFARLVTEARMQDKEAGYEGSASVWITTALYRAARLEGIEL